MASVRLDVISIGTLSRNLLWNEPGPVRTAHATCSLIRAGKQHILVDPGLPGPALAARLFERTGLRPEQINTVFLTNFRPAHRAGLSIFHNANYLIHQNEIDFVTQTFETLLKNLPDDDEDPDTKNVRGELELLQRFSPAEDEVAPGVDLFPLFGYTAGNCGLLISAPTTTLLVAGDAVPTQDHFLAGQVLPDALNVEQAQESLREAYEIADVVVPGHDNLFLNPRLHGV
jgi:glyoxylase-like metal-dependent hydrolase (beta-lactamase superfamily II)